MTNNDTAQQIKNYEMQFATDLADYVKHLQETYKTNPDTAAHEARQALLRTGVIQGFQTVKTKS